MYSPKILQHKRPALAGIPPEVMLAVERMTKAVALIAGSHEKRIQRIERLRVIVEALKQLTERVTIDRVENICRAFRVLVFEKPLINTARYQQHTTKFGFEKLGRFRSFTEFLVDIIECWHDAHRLLSFE